MSWTANIFLNSGKNVLVDNLISINKKSIHDSTVSKLTDFEEFHLLKGEKLSFIGEKSLVSLNTNEIEYVELSKRD